MFSFRNFIISALPLGNWGITSTTSYTLPSFLSCGVVGVCGVFGAFTSAVAVRAFVAVSGTCVVTCFMAVTSASLFWAISWVRVSALGVANATNAVAATGSTASTLQWFHLLDFDFFIIVIRFLSEY